MQQFSFGPFLLDVERNLFFDRDSPIALGTRGLALLRALVTAKGQVVTKGELMDAAWPNTNVEESNLTVQIAQLRKRLGTSADSEEWIATVPRTGYRFAGRLQLVSASTAFQTPDSLGPQSMQKASIAVLPFNNMSSDPEQEYFAEGLSEDLITDLSKIPGLLVIARNSSFAYKGRPLDVRQVARELGVRYIIEGSVRRAASQVRINAQVIDAVDHSHVWADRFDRDLADIFALQDEIVDKIVTALAGALPSAPPIAARRPTNIEAYDLAVRGRTLSLRSPDEARAGRSLLAQAIALDPTFAEAHAWLAQGHMAAWAFLGEPMENHRRSALEAGRRAVFLDPENADAHANLGYVLVFDGKRDEGGAELDTSLRINPNHADAWVYSGELAALRDEAVQGIERIHQGFRLNPYSPSWYYWILGYAQFAAGRYEDAVATLRHEATHRTGSQRVLAAALAQLGRIDDARREARDFMTMVPNFSAREWASTQPFKNETDLQRFLDGYLKAGLPA